MYNREIIGQLVDFISSKDGRTDKSRLQNEVQEAFGLVKDRSVYYCDWFAIRFCKAASRSFGNTVLALSALHRYDGIPFIVCLVTPTRNYLMLANTTFLRKISHSSQELRRDNIKGSFNGSDIMREFEGIENIPENFEFLYNSHENYTFEENLDRLVEATNNIAPTGKRFVPTELQVECIRESVDRAISFLNSAEYGVLNDDLNDRVRAVESEIAIAAFIDNVNLRGRIIEYLITAEDDLKATLMNCLHTRQPLPEIFTADELGDYEREFEHSPSFAGLPQTEDATPHLAGRGRVPPSTGATGDNSLQAPESNAAPCACISVPRLPAAASSRQTGGARPFRPRRGWRNPAPA